VGETWANPLEGTIGLVENRPSLPVIEARQ
jgi:hypothetical protein